MKLKIVDLRKFIRMVVIIGIIILSILFIGLTNTYSKGEVKYKEEYVTTGDTLWSIANQEVSSNDYYKEKDIRDVIQEIKAINQLESGTLSVGQKILLPTI